MREPSDNIPEIDVVLDRLDRIEARISAVEARPTSNTEALRAQIPGIFESLLDAHVDDVRARLKAEMRESTHATLTSFERKMDEKVSGRIATLEKALIDQSSIVTTLSQRAVEAEQNFQRLIAAVERLCERKEQPALDLPFERQPGDAFQRQPAAPGLPFDPGFRPRILKEEDTKPRHRKPLTRL